MNRFARYGLPFAVVALAVLSQPILASAQTDQPPKQTQKADLKKSAAKHIAKPRWRQSTAVRRNLYGAVPAQEPAGCTWPYRNQFPPCMSTWPAGDPNYHGSRPGPTFFDEN